MTLHYLYEMAGAAIDHVHGLRRLVIGALTTGHAKLSP